MALEPRPRLFNRKTFALLVAFAAGALGLLLVLWKIPPSTIEGTAAAPGRPVHFLLKQAASFWLVAGGVFTSLLTASIFELFGMLVQWQAWRIRDRKTFDAFFGDDAADRSGEGLILLEGSSIDTLLQQHASQSLKEKIDSTSSSRLFKARNWVNFFDTECARAIVSAFRELALEPPKVVQTKVGSAPIDEASAPFTIIVGLSELAVERIGRSCAGWMRVGLKEGFGDVVELLHNLVPDRLARLDHVDSEPAAAELEAIHRFRSILPRSQEPRTWNVQKWLQEDSSSRDYAIIFRHTEVAPDGSKHVTFVLGGFTERGTAAAGVFLSRNWKNLCEEHVARSRNDGNRGDFLIFIEGPSVQAQWQEWAVDQHLGVITPDRVRRAAPDLNGPWIDGTALSGRAH